MISVLNQSNEYIVQQRLTDMHKRTTDGISATELWKRELTFFQKILDGKSKENSNVDFKKQVSHFQNLITYYNGELVDEIRKELKEHEHHLAHLLQTKNESETGYFKEHDGVIEKLDTFAGTFTEFKHDLFDFIERGYSAF